MQGNQDSLNIRPARLKDSEKLSNLQKSNYNNFDILDIPKSPEKIRLSIGSGMLNKNKYFVAERNDKIIGFIEHDKTNESHVMLGYPYVSLDEENRYHLQKEILNRILQKLKSYGYQFASTQVSQNMSEGYFLYQEFGFGDPTPILQTFHGEMSPDPDIDTHPYQIRKVDIDDVDITYSWIKRQLNPLSPIYISKKNYSRMVRGPKKIRKGWAMATLDDKPVAFVSSMKDVNTGQIIVFGPFNDEDHVEARIPLFNELLMYHKLRGNENLRLMRISLFDNDEELINKYDLEKDEEITVLTKKL